jgi:peptide/nickel transport system permease protein
MSEPLTAVGTGTTEPPVDQGSRRDRRRGGTLGLAGWFCAAWLALVAAGAVLAPWLPLDEPDITDFFVDNNSTPGTGGHLLGTDQNGFDILSRLVWGGRVSLIVALGVLAIGMVVGGAIGVLAGFFRGWSETLLMSVVDIFLAFPALILLIAIVAFRGANLFNVVIGISLVSIPAFARIARATTLTFSQREFVVAARAAGAGNGRILVREIPPTWSCRSSRSGC